MLDQTMCDVQLMNHARRIADVNTLGWHTEHSHQQSAQTSTTRRSLHVLRRLIAAPAFVLKLGAETLAR